LIEALGLYFDSEALSLVHVQKRGGRAPVYGAASFPHPSPDSPDRAREAAVPRIKEYLLLNRIKTDEVWAVAPADEVLFKTVHLPRAASENLSDVLEYEFENFFPFKKEDVLYDYLLLGDKEKSDSELRVLLAVLKRQRYEFYWNLLQKAGLTPVGLEAPLSARISMVSWLYRRKRLSFPLLAAYPRRQSWELLLCLGANRFRFFRFGRNGPSDGIADVLSSHGKTIWNGTQPEVLYSLVLASGNVPTEPLDEPYKQVDGDECFRYARLPRFSPAVFHALGAALRGLDRPAPILDLLAPEKRRKPKRAQMYAFFLLAALGMILGIAAVSTPYLQARFSLRELERRYEALTPEIRELEAKRANLDRVRSDMEVLTRVKHYHILNMLLELTPLVPENTWIRNLDLKGDVIQIQGYSENASELIPLLENSAYFKDVEFTSPVVKRGNLEDFNITMRMEE